MENTNITLSVIIVNYNGEKLLGNCIGSIQKHTDCKHEIIVVDNASTDNSVELLEQHFPFVKLIKNKNNVGFAAGNNIGVSKTTGKYILLLNNDTILLSPLLKVIEKFKSNPKIGVLGCTLRFDNRAIQPSFGYEHTPIRIIFSWLINSKMTRIPKIFKRSEIDTKRYYDKERKVDWVSGAALFTKTDLWNRLNGLDEKYFMYVEDVDYCRRVRELGYNIVYSPDTEIIHLERSGKKTLSLSSLNHTTNSYLIYTKKYYGIAANVFVHIGLGLIFLLRSIYYFISVIFDKKNKWEQSKIFLKTGIRLILFKI